MDWKLWGYAVYGTVIVAAIIVVLIGLALFIWVHPIVGIIGVVILGGIVGYVFVMFLFSLFNF